MNTSFIRRVLKTPLPEDKEYELNLFEAEIEKEKQEEEEKLTQYATEEEEKGWNSATTTGYLQLYKFLTGQELKGGSKAKPGREFIEKAFIKAVVENPEILQKITPEVINSCAPDDHANHNNVVNSLTKFLEKLPKDAEAAAQKAKEAQDAFNQENAAAEADKTMEIQKNETTPPTEEKPAEGEVKKASVDSFSGKKTYEEFVKYFALAYANRNKAPEEKEETQPAEEHTTEEEQLSQEEE